MFERSKKGEHALLIQPHAGGPPDQDALEEFADLARSAGATVAGVLTARIDRPNAAMLIGTGKLEEVKAAADASGADLILVNYPLRPGQERNLERLLERRVVDRTGLILDIFSQRAHSSEGKLQGTVESFDQFVVLLKNSVSQMVYKHAISTVVPARNVRLAPGGGHAQAGGDGDDEHGGNGDEAHDDGE